MTLFEFRKETDPDLLAAAAVAYDEAPPNRTGNSDRFARLLNHRPASAHRDDLAAEVRRNHQRIY